MQVELRPRSLGENLGLTFSLALKHAWKLIIIQAVIWLPSLALDFVTQDLATSTDPDASMQLALVSMAMLLFSVLLGQITTGAGIVAVSESFTGKPAPLGLCFATAFRRFLPLLGYAFLTGLIYMVGAILLLIPMLIFMTWYYVGACAVVLEDMPAVRAMDRSKGLSEGHRWTIFGFLFLLAIVAVWVPSMIAGFLIIGTGNEGSTLQLVLTWGLGVLFAILQTVGPVVIYFDLRAKKEAFDLEELAGLVDLIGQRAGGAR